MSKRVFAGANGGGRRFSPAGLIAVAALVVMAAAVALLFRADFMLWLEPSDFDPYIAKAAAKYGVDPDLVRAVIYTETKFNPDTVGAAGEIGLMQILPSGAAAEYAKSHHRPPFSRIQLFNPALNIEIGTWFLAQGIKRYEPREDAVSLAICRYNAGESRANRWAKGDGGDLIDRIDIAGTRLYLQKVLTRMELYRKQGR